MINTFSAAFNAGKRWQIIITLESETLLSMQQLQCMHCRARFPSALIYRVELSGIKGGIYRPCPLTPHGLSAENAKGAIGVFVTCAPIH